MMSHFRCECSNGHPRIGFDPPSLRQVPLTAPETPICPLCRALAGVLHVPHEARPVSRPYSFPCLPMLEYADDEWTEFLRAHGLPETTVYATIDRYGRVTGVSA